MRQAREILDFDVAFARATQLRDDQECAQLHQA